MVAGRGKQKNVQDIPPEVSCLHGDVVQAGMQAREERERREGDDNKKFLLTFLNQLKRIPEHLRFGVRIQIMQGI